MLQRILWLSLAGACGTVCRYVLWDIAEKSKNTQFPLGTFAVNMLGSFLFGLLYALAQRKLNLTAEMRIIVLTGFLGAFTTFSTYAFETARLMKSAQWTLAAGNICAQTGLGIAAIALGVLIGRLI